MKDKIKLLSVKPLKSGKKKYEAKFEIEKSNGKTRNKTIKFGAKGMSDFTIHKDTERRDRYISRHKKDLRTNDPTRAGYLSMYILWNKKTFKASLADYKRRLNTYNRTGKFPIAISGSALKSKFGNMSEFGIISRLDLLPRDVQQTLREEILKRNEIYKKEQSLEQKYYEPYEKDFVELLEYFNSLKIPDLLYYKPIIKKLYEGFVESIDYPILLSNPNYSINIRNYNKSKELFISLIKKITDNNINISYNNFESDIDNPDIKKYFNQTNFGVKNVTFKDEPMIKFYEIEGKLKRREFPNQRIRKTPIKSKIIYILEFNQLSLDFAKFLGDYHNKSLFINSNLSCLLYIFKTFFRRDKKIIDKNEFIQYYNTYFIADGRLKDESCIRDKGILITTLFNTDQGKNMIKQFNDFVERKIKLRKKMNEIKFGKSFYELPSDFLNIQDENNDINYDINNFGKYKVPDNVKNKSLYLRIKNKIGKEVKKKGRRWGAYDSGRLVREYKEKGGKYSGKKSTKTKSKKSSNLDRWYREKWIDACAWPKRKSCGRTKASIKSKVTYCRPSKIIDRNTPKTIQELTKAEIKRKCAKKSKNPKKIIR